MCVYEPACINVNIKVDRVMDPCDMTSTQRYVECSVMSFKCVIFIVCELVSVFLHVCEYTSGFFCECVDPCTSGVDEFYVFEYMSDLMCMCVVLITLQ